MKSQRYRRTSESGTCTLVLVGVPWINPILTAPLTSGVAYIEQFGRLRRRNTQVRRITSIITNTQMFEIVVVDV